MTVEEIRVFITDNWEWIVTGLSILGITFTLWRTWNKATGLWSFIRGIFNFTTFFKIAFFIAIAAIVYFVFKK